MWRAATPWNRRSSWAATPRTSSTARRRRLFAPPRRMGNKSGAEHGGVLFFTGVCMRNVEGKQFSFRHTRKTNTARKTAGLCPVCRTRDTGGTGKRDVAAPLVSRARTDGSSPGESASVRRRPMPCRPGVAQRRPARTVEAPHDGWEIRCNSLQDALQAQYRPRARAVCRTRGASCSPVPPHV